MPTTNIFFIIDILHTVLSFNTDNGVVFFNKIVLNLGNQIKLTMKTLTFLTTRISTAFLLFWVLSAHAQSSIQVGCFSGTTGTMAYSTGNMNTIVRLLLQTDETVSNSTIKYASNDGGFFYIESIVGTTKVGIDLDKVGSNLTVAGGKCTHKCKTNAGCTACTLTILIKCESIECACTGGSGGCDSEITTGATTITEDLIDFISNNQPNCQ